MATITQAGEVVAGLRPCRKQFELIEFVVGPPNIIAYAAMNSLAEGQLNPNFSFPVVLCGGCGVGKTHLMLATRRSFARNFRLSKLEGPVYTTAENFANYFFESIREKKTDLFRRWARRAYCLFVDEIGFFKGKKATQDEFLETLEERLRKGLPTVCACNFPPVELGLSKPLESRLMGGSMIMVEPLDATVRRGLLNQLITKAESEGPWGEQVREYLSAKMNGDARGVIGVFNTIELIRRAKGLPVTTELVDKALVDCGLKKDELPELSLEKIERVVEEFFSLIAGGSHQLRSASRARAISYPRQLAMFLCKKLLPDLRLGEIGEYFGNRDHTTALAAIAKIERDRRKSETVKRDLEGLCQRLKVKYPFEN